MTNLSSIVRRLGIVLGIISTCIILPLVSLAGASALPEQTPVHDYVIVKTYPHDNFAFTQGLVFSDGVLYEGTGLWGQSSLRKVTLESGKVLQYQPLAKEYFGEGITVFGDQIMQLTWQSKVGFIYDKHTFELLDTFTYPTEGWGLTHDGERLIMSDGSATLYFRHLETFAEIGRIDVYDENGPVYKLNELEYIKGEIYANIWHTDRIARIDPTTGRVTSWIDLAGLLEPGEVTNSEAVLNGIAYDGENDRLFVTGKLWPKLFEIKPVPDITVKPQPSFTYTLYLPAITQN